MTMVDLGKYAVPVIGSYVASLALLAALVGLTVWQEPQPLLLSLNTSGTDSAALYFKMLSAPSLRDFKKRTKALTLKITSWNSRFWQTSVTAPCALVNNAM